MDDAFLLVCFVAALLFVLGIAAAIFDAVQLWRFRRNHARVMRHIRNQR